MDNQADSLLRCYVCGSEHRKTGKRLPRGWKRSDEQHICGSCWSTSRVLRTVTMPVAEPIDVSWEQPERLLTMLGHAPYAKELHTSRDSQMSALRIIPITLSEANDFVRQFHRHHAPVVGHRWSIGVIRDGTLCGVAICGRPKARLLPQATLLEINRLATDGTKNACSKLYAACARIARLMGFHHIETAILESEPGTSLRAAGYEFRRMTAGGDWNRPSRAGRRTDQPTCRKQIWGKCLWDGHAQTIASVPMRKGGR